MSLDRFVRWGTARTPTSAEIRMVCEDFVGAAGDVICSEESGRLVIRLPGSCSNPFSRVLPGVRVFEDGERRWIEVFEHEDSIDVITRMHDDFTNGLAQRLAEVFAREWDGTVET